MFQFDDQRLHLLRGELHTDDGLVLDLLHSLGELQRLDGLFEVAVCSACGTKQCSLRVSSETLLEQFGQSRFSKWNIATFTESLDHTTENCERQVDLLGFFKNLARGTSLRNTLRSSQINQVKLGIFLGAVLVDLVVFKNQN